MKKINILILSLSILSLGSCVSKKKFTEATQTIENLNRINKDLKDDISSLKSRLNLMEDANSSAATEIDQYQNTLSQKELDLRNKDLALREKEEKIQHLQELMDRQKKNIELVRQKLANALGHFDADQLSVFTKNGKVYVSLSEKLLFPSGSAEVNKEGKDALSQVAEALKGNNDLQINIEGHTDSIPIKIKFQDNWALSVARSTSIVRILTNDYGVDPLRISASGRSQYEPIDTNNTPEGRAKNRRTEIILTPKLDEIMSLISQ